MNPQKREALKAIKARLHAATNAELAAAVADTSFLKWAGIGDALSDDVALPVRSFSLVVRYDDADTSDSEWGVQHAYSANNAPTRISFQHA